MLEPVKYRPKQHALRKELLMSDTALCVPFDTKAEPGTVFRGISDIMDHYRKKAEAEKVLLEPTILYPIGFFVEERHLCAMTDILLSAGLRACVQNRVDRLRFQIAVFGPNLMAVSVSGQCGISLETEEKIRLKRATEKYTHQLQESHFLERQVLAVVLEQDPKQAQPYAGSDLFYLEF